MISDETYEFIVDNKQDHEGKFVDIELNDGALVSGTVLLISDTDVGDVLKLHLVEHKAKVLLLYTESFIDRMGENYIIDNKEKCIKSILFSTRKESTKPPIGLRPKYIVQSERLEEITQAIQRYIENNIIIPSEWMEEYNELVENLTKEGKL